MKDKTITAKSPKKAKLGTQISLFEEFEEIKNKFNDSTSTVDELRLAIFAPVQTFSHNSKTALELKAKKKIVRKTNWGQMTVEGTLLSQKHRDLLDCVLTYGLQTDLKDGTNTIAYSFSGYEMLKRYYGEDTKTQNTDAVHKLLKDMQKSLISIESESLGKKASFQIFSFVGYDKNMGAFVVKFNNDYVRFFTNSLTVNYEDELPDIIKIKNPIIKAIVRLALTQKSALTMKVYDPDAQEGKTGMLEAIGFPIEAPSQKKEAYKVLKENAELLKSFGVYYNPNEKSTIRYKKKLDIRFVPPVTHKKLVQIGNNEEDFYVKLQDFIGQKFIKENAAYEVSNVYLDDSIDKIILECFASEDKNKKIRKLEIANIPSKAYEWLEKQILTKE